MAKTVNILNEEIETILERVGDFDSFVDSETYTNVLEIAESLMDREIRYRELEHKIQKERAELEASKKERVSRNIIGIAGIVIPSVITIWGTVKTLKFEETGSITTTIGRGFINKLIPKK